MIIMVVVCGMWSMIAMETLDTLKTNLVTTRGLMLEVFVKPNKVTKQLNNSSSRLTANLQILYTKYYKITHDISVILDGHGDSNSLAVLVLFEPNLMQQKHVHKALR